MSTSSLPLPGTGPVPATATAPAHRLAFQGDGLTLLGIFLVNALLTIVTLGVYYFWGKARLRRYFVGHVQLDGEPFAYHGTGIELFVGWLKVIGIFLVASLVMGGLSALAGKDQLLQALIVIPFYLGFLFLIPVAIVGARRFALSRTSWRGVRFSFRGQVGEFARIFIPGALLTGLTLGFYGPYFWSNVYGYLTDHSYFGNRRFSYSGRGGDLFGMYIKGLLLGILTLGIYFFWFQAERTRYLVGKTSFGNVKIDSTVTGGGLFGLAITNMLLMIVTLGLAMPWILVRNVRFYADNLQLYGAFDLADVRQDIQRTSATGEELADVLDVDTGLGL